MFGYRRNINRHLTFYERFDIKQDKKLDKTSKIVVKRDERDKEQYLK